jgi:hypothetical protein
MLRCSPRGSLPLSTLHVSQKPMRKKASHNVWPLLFPQRRLVAPKNLAEAAGGEGNKELCFGGPDRVCLKYSRRDSNSSLGGRRLVLPVVPAGLLSFWRVFTSLEHVAVWEMGKLLFQSETPPGQLLFFSGPAPAELRQRLLRRSRLEARRTETLAKPSIA